MNSKQVPWEFSQINNFNLLADKYWNDVIQRHSQQQEGKPSPFAFLDPDDSLNLLRCRDVHPNPGPPKISKVNHLSLSSMEEVKEKRDNIEGDMERLLKRLSLCKLSDPTAENDKRKLISKLEELNDADMRDSDPDPDVLFAIRGLYDHDEIRRRAKETFKNILQMRPDDKGRDKRMPHKYSYKRRIQHYAKHFEMEL